MSLISPPFPFRLLVPKLYLGIEPAGAVRDGPGPRGELREKRINAAALGSCTASRLWLGHRQCLRSKASGISSVPKCNLGTRKSRKCNEQNPGLIAVSLLWLPVSATLLVGVSLGLPLFLFLRQRKLDADPGALT
jgi:hypothetical protein